MPPDDSVITRHDCIRNYLFHLEESRFINRPPKETANPVFYNWFLWQFLKLAKFAKIMMSLILT